MLYSSDFRDRVLLQPIREGAGFTKDCEKYNEATKLGWKVYRFTATMIHNGDAITTMMEALC